MKKKLQIYLVLLFILLIVVFTCVSATQPIQAPPTLSSTTTSIESTTEATNTTSLLFLGNQNIAPVIYLNGNTPSGVAIDIVHALAYHISQPIEIRAMNWSEAQALVAQGDADALIQINPTEERKKVYDFSDPLLESHFSIFTRADKIGISGVSSLRGLKVGVESGGFPQHLLESDPYIKLAIIPNFTEGFNLLNAGSLDAVLVDYRVGSYILAQNNIRNIKVTGEPIASSSSSFAVKKGNTKLLNEINSALQIIKADGTYQKIIDNWKPTETVFETHEQITNRIYYGIILILLILFLIAFIWTVTIKKELTKRKAAEEELQKLYSELEHRVNERTMDLRLAQEALYQVNKKLNLLTSITRHDINNQLIVLMAFLSLLEKKNPDTAYSEYFRKIENAATRISVMIQFTKEYESIGATAPVWQDCCILVDKAAKQSQLGKIIVNNNLPTGSEVFADPLIAKVFYNLIDNAVRYGGNITIIRFFVQKSGDDHLIVCDDDGEGILINEKEKIFERGFGKNTGLGLALSREILDITGIDISETGEPGKGARFEIKVPDGKWRFRSEAS